MIALRPVWLHRTSWVGASIGAVHYYGELKWNRVKPDGFNHYHEFTLTRPMNRAEIRAQNAEYAEQGLVGLKVRKGATTRGFFTEQEVARRAKEVAARLFNKDRYILIDSDTGCCSASPILHIPEAFAADGMRLNELAKEWKRSGGYGFSFRGVSKEQERHAHDLDEEWYSTIQKLTKNKLCDRRQLLSRFAAGETQVVVNCGVLTEGFDDPGVEVIIMARPTKSIKRW